MLLLLSASTRRALPPYLLCAWLSVGCGGPDVADLAAQELTLTVSGVTTEPDVAKIGEPRAGLGVSRAVLSTTSLRFEPCQADVDELLLGPRSYELLADPAPSERVTTAVQELCRLELEIGPAGASSPEGVPKRAALYVEAQNDSGDQLSFESDETSTLRFATDPGASFGREPLLLGIDFGVWLANLAEQDADAASERLAAQLQDAAALYVDANGNGELDDAERTPLLTSQPPPSASAP